MKVFIGSDHAGFELKEKLKVYLDELGHDVEDKGAFTFNKDDDYPDFVRPVARAVANEKGSFGFVLGTSGQGENMVANKVAGIRAAEYHGGNLEVVSLTREHNDSNILSLGARFVPLVEAQEAVKLFLNTKFENAPRHIRRIKKLD